MKYVGDDLPLIYVIEQQWTNNYIKYLEGNQQSTIPPIDNQKLLKNQAQQRVHIGSQGISPLKDGLKKDQHYSLLNEKAWKFVQQLYGGGPEITMTSQTPLKLTQFNLNQLQCQQQIKVQALNRSQEIHQTCPICYNELADLQTVCLPCKHIFCLPCIETIAEKLNLLCPMCRAVFSQYYLCHRGQDGQQINGTCVQIKKKLLNDLSEFNVNFDFGLFNENDLHQFSENEGGEEDDSDALEEFDNIGFDDFSQNNNDSNDGDWMQFNYHNPIIQNIRTLNNNDNGQMLNHYPITFFDDEFLENGIDDGMSDLQCDFDMENDSY